VKNKMKNKKIKKQQYKWGVAPSLREPPPIKIATQVFNDEG
jgi:hypothetical protein